MLRRIEDSGADAHGRQHLSAFRPQQISEQGSIGKAGSVDARAVHRELLFQGGHHGIEELKVAIVESLLSRPHLPAEPHPAGIDLAWRLEALGINDDGPWPGG